MFNTESRESPGYINRTIGLCYGHHYLMFQLSFWEIMLSVGSVCQMAINRLLHYPWASSTVTKASLSCSIYSDIFCYIIMYSTLKWLKWLKKVCIKATQNWMSQLHQCSAPEASQLAFDVSPQVIMCTVYLWLFSPNEPTLFKQSSYLLHVHWNKCWKWSNKLSLNTASGKLNGIFTLRTLSAQNNPAHFTALLMMARI